MLRSLLVLAVAMSGCLAEDYLFSGCDASICDEYFGTQSHGCRPPSSEAGNMERFVQDHQCFCNCGIPENQACNTTSQCVENTVCIETDENPQKTCSDFCKIKGYCKNQGKKFHRCHLGECIARPFTCEEFGLSVDALIGGVAEKYPTMCHAVNAYFAASVADPDITFEVSASIESAAAGGI